MKLKEVIKKKAIGNHKLSDYLAVGIPAFLAKKEEAFLCFDTQKIKVTVICILYEPSMVGIHFSDEKPTEAIDTAKIYTVVYYGTNSEQCIGQIYIQHERTISVNATENIHLFKVTDADLKLPNLRLKLTSVLLYWKLKRNHKSFLTEFNQRHYRMLTTLFTHPRLVRLLTIDVENHQRHFPIDLCMHVENKVVFGLRNSNHSSEYLKEGATICLSDVQLAYKPMIYGLGKFGKKTESDINFIETEVLKIEIPDLFYSYVEVKLVEVIPYDNQTIYLADVLHHCVQEQRKDEFLLAHIQMLRYIKQPLAYPHKVI